MSRVMASVRLMHKMLQCSLCHMQYNLGNRIPKGMRCMHTFCKACLDSIAQRNMVKCPTCKRDTHVPDLVSNCAITDVLETLCEECTNEERQLVCHHCEKNLCTSCYEVHAATYHSEVKLELQGLVGEIEMATKLLMDDTAFEDEREKEEEAVIEIKAAIQYHRNELDRLEKELKDKVKLLNNTNVKKLLEWREQLENQIGKTNQFVMHSENKLGVSYSRNCMYREMAEIYRECSKMSTSLKHIKNVVPKLIPYSFKAAEDVVLPALGHIDLDESDRQAVFSVANYKHANVKYSTGSFGSGIHELNHPRSVACMEDRVFVVDEYNHRIKVYDHNLRLMFVFGQKGTKSNHFQHPWGIAITQDEEIYITDCLNHRIKVYNKYGQKLRIFGSKGTGPTEFKRPLGIAINAFGDELYICDADNYRIKVVQRDGTCLRYFGSKGDEAGNFTSIPKSVSITSDERVLVTEGNKIIIHVLSRDGEYMSSYPKQTTELSEINSAAVDPQNNVVVACQNGDLIILNAKGGLVCMVNPMEQLSAASGVVVTKEGHMFVSDIGNHAVHVFKVGL